MVAGNIVQFIGGSAPIGSVEYTAPAGSTYTKADGSVWLQSGLTQPASSYSIAAATANLMVNGLSATMPSANAITGLACDPTGTYWVATYQSSTNVAVSTNSGQTWSNVAHNMAVAAVDVTYGNGHFVVCGNSTTTINTAIMSSPFTSFSANSTTAITSGTASTARITYGNNSFAVVAAGSGTGTVATASNAGTTFTAQNTPIATANPSIAYSSSASLWIINSSAAANFLTSASLSTGTYTQRTGPAEAGGYSPLAANGTCVLMPTATSVYRTVDCINWTLVNTYFSSNASNISIKSNGTTFFVAPVEVGGTVSTDAAFFTTTDGLNYTRRWNAILINGGVLLGAGSTLVYTPNSGTTTAAMYSNTWPNADFVGSSIITTLATTGNSYSALAYYRIA